MPQIPHGASLQLEARAAANPSDSYGSNADVGGTDPPPLWRFSFFFSFETAFLPADRYSASTFCDLEAQMLSPMTTFLVNYGHQQMHPILNPLNAPDISITMDIDSSYIQSSVDPAFSNPDTSSIGVSLSPKRHTSDSTADQIPKNKR